MQKNKMPKSYKRIAEILEDVFGILNFNSEQISSAKTDLDELIKIETLNNLVHEIEEQDLKQLRERIKTMKGDGWQEEIAKILKNKYSSADIELKMSLSADKILADYLELILKNASEEQRAELLVTLNKIKNEIG